MEVSSHAFAHPRAHEVIAAHERVIRLAPDNSPAAETEANFFLAEADDPEVAEASDAPAIKGRSQRLSRIVEEHGHLASGELRERILREIEAFVGGADQHDDMTMILMKIERAAEARVAV